MKKILLFGITALLLSACAKKVEKPTWLRIEKWQLNSNPFAGDQGELTQNISEVWLNMDGKALGVYQLPITIPIIASEGSHNFVLIPGIKNNGISATKTRYNFLKQYSISTTLSKTDTALIQPETEYFENLTFWIEDFENINSLKMDEATTSQVDLQTTDDPNIVDYGNYCGHIQLTETDTSFYAFAIDPMYLPQNGSEIYMEVDYRNSHDLSARLIHAVGGSTNDDALVTMREQSNPIWKKIYINLREVVVQRANSDYYSIALRAIKRQNSSIENIYIDNIKVIY